MLPWEDYLLVKVEMDAQGDRWFGKPLPREPEVPGEPAARGLFRRHRAKKKLRREYEQRRREYIQGAEALETSVRQLAEEVLTALERTEARGEAGCVYDEELKFLCRDGNLSAELWRRFWNIPEFRDYRELRWVQPLLAEVKGPYFILLGTAPCIPRILEQCARRMKSLCWYLREEECTEEVQQFAEDFYVEYGLAIALHPLSGRNVFRTLCLNFAEPVWVLDFTEEEKIYAGGLKEGSVWLDFSSIEEKKRRVRRLSSGVQYDSLISRWKSASRRRPYCL